MFYTVVYSANTLTGVSGEIAGNTAAAFVVTPIRLRMNFNLFINASSPFLVAGQQRCRCLGMLSVDLILDWHSLLFRRFLSHLRYAYYTIGGGGSIFGYKKIALK